MHLQRGVTWNPQLAQYDCFQLWHRFFWDLFSDSWPCLFPWVPKIDCLLSWPERQRPFFTNQNQMTGDCYRFGTFSHFIQCFSLPRPPHQKRPTMSNPNWRQATLKMHRMSVEKNCGPLSFPPRWIILWNTRAPLGKLLIHLPRKLTAGAWTSPF